MRRSASILPLSVRTSCRQQPQRTCRERGAQPTAREALATAMQRIDLEHAVDVGGTQRLDHACESRLLLLRDRRLAVLRPRGTVEPPCGADVLEVERGRAQRDRVRTAGCRAASACPPARAGGCARRSGRRPRRASSRWTRPPCRTLHTVRLRATQCRPSLPNRSTRSPLSWMRPSPVPSRATRPEACRRASPSVRRSVAGIGSAARASSTRPGVSRARSKASPPIVPREASVAG